MSEELTQGLPQDGVRQILSRLDSIDTRLMSLEDKVNRWLEVDPPNLDTRFRELETESRQ